jgi:hypothetical protein
MPTGWPTPFPLSPGRWDGATVHPLLLRAMERHAGVFATADALAAGVDPNSIGPLLRSGVWRRVRYGVYTTDTVWREHEAQGRVHRLECAAVLRRLEGDGVVSHTSAARLHTLVVPRGLSTEVRLTQPGQFRTGKGYRISEAPLLSEDAVELDGLRVTSISRTLADVGREWQLGDTVVAADDALADGRVSLRELQTAALAQTHWVGCGSAARAFSLARVGAHSPHETRTRLALLRAGLPEPLLQQAVLVGSRVIAVLDMYWPDHGVFAECDGMVKYTDPWRGRSPLEALRDEKRRHDDLLDLDLRGVRLTPDDVRERLDEKVARLSALLGRERQTPPRYRTMLWKSGLRTTPRSTAA